MIHIQVELIRLVVFWFVLILTCRVSINKYILFWNMLNQHWWTINVDVVSVIIYAHPMQHPIKKSEMYHLFLRMDNIPSANMRQHKLDQQRRLIEEKQRQKRFEERNIKLTPLYSTNFRAAQNKRIELSDLKAGAQSRPGSSSKRELHGWDAQTRECLCNRVQWCWCRYDGPLQYLAQTGNPDSAMTTVQVGVKQKYRNIFKTCLYYCISHLRRERRFKTT